MVRCLIDTPPFLILQKKFLKPSIELHRGFQSKLCQVRPKVSNGVVIIVSEEQEQQQQEGTVKETQYVCTVTNCWVSNHKTQSKFTHFMTFLQAKADSYYSSMNSIFFFTKVCTNCSRPKQPIRDVELDSAGCSHPDYREVKRADLSS